jgi:hypothetical protein
MRNLGLMDPAFLGRMSQLWTPAQISTALWLDAADSSTITTVSGGVSQWNDKSGNGRDATQATADSRPTLISNGLNSNPVLSFNGANTQHLIHPLNASPAPHTVFAVVRRTAGGTTAFQNIVNAVAPNGAFGVALTAKVLEGGGPGSVSGTAGANWGGYINTSLGHTHANSSLLNSWSVIGIVSPSSTSGTETYIANGTVTATVSYSSRYGGDSNNRRAIGGDPVFNTGWFWGNIAEIVINSFAASTSIRQQLEGYLAHKWGLTANLPNDHPFKVSPPYV